MWMLVLMGCLKNEPKHIAPSPMDVRVVTVLGDVDADEVSILPEGTIARVSEQLELRQLVPRVEAEVGGVFAERRSWPARLEAMGEMSEPMLLVACDARFDTQVNGRFRWQVECDLAMGAGEPWVLGRVSAPAHLVYYHQREDEAVAEMEGTLAREVGVVLDQWLAQTL